MLAGVPLNEDYRFLPERNVSTMHGFPLAVTIAVAVTAIVAIGMVAVMLRRTMRPTRLTVGISLSCALAVLLGALLVGGALPQTATAAAGSVPVTRCIAHAPLELKLDGLQLPTL